MQKVTLITNYQFLKLSFPAAVKMQNNTIISCQFNIIIFDIIFCCCKYAKCPFRFSFPTVSQIAIFRCCKNAKHHFHFISFQIFTSFSAAVNVQNVTII